MEWRDLVKNDKNVEITDIVKPAVAYIESELRTYSYVRTYQAAESDTEHEHGKNAENIGRSQGLPTER